jgi:hypothetical protein
MSPANVAAHVLPVARGVGRQWLSRLLAILIGIDAAAGVLFGVWQLIPGLGVWSFLLLVGLFGLLCSVAGVLGAIGLWRSQRLGWWIAAWFCLFNVLGTFAPFAILGRRPEFDAFQAGWIVLLCSSIAYLFTPSVRAAYRITAAWPVAFLRILGVVLLCILLQLGYTVYIVVRATWFSS